MELIPKNVSEFYQLIPIAKIGNALSVAMADPLNIFAIDDLKLMTGLDIVPIIGTESDITSALSSYYSQKSDMTEFLKDVEEPQLELKREEDAEINLDKLKVEGDEAPIIKLVNLVLVEAIEERASDIHIEPFEHNMSLRYRIDGVLYEKTPPPKSMQNAITSRVKIMSKLDIAERRLPQDGRFKIKIKSKDVDFRVSTLPTVFGEKIVLRILDKTRAVMDIDNLGFHEKALRDLKEALVRPFGMILVTGPTGSGKTTTLYSCLVRLEQAPGERHYCRRPCRIPAEGHQPGPRKDGNRADLCRRASLHPPAGPKHNTDRRDPRPGNSRHRHQSGPDGTPCPQHPPHQ